jgi:hypothetical protein
MSALFETNIYRNNIPHSNFYSKNVYIKWLLIVGIIFLFTLYIPDAYCADLGRLTKTLESKIADITKVIDTIAKAGVGVGLLWFIISLIRGEPQYKYAFLLVLAGCLLYTASYIAKWAVGA